MFPSAIRSISGQIAEDIIATGEAGNVTISTRQLSVRDGGAITTATSGGGVGGNLAVTVQNTTELVGSGSSTTGIISSILSTVTRGGADAGSLRLDTGQLSIREGAGISASTFGSGAAGDVEVVADTIDVLGVREDQLFPSAIRSISGGTIEDIFTPGEAGNITIASRRLSIEDGVITTLALGEALAGSIEVNVQNRLEVKNGQISTTSRLAEGGDIRINTAEGFGSGVVVLRGDSDITTSSKSDGGQY